MIRDEDFRLSRNPFALDLGSFTVSGEDDHPSAWCQVSAVWFRSRKGIVRACTGTIRGLLRPPPADVSDFLERYIHDPWGGSCAGRWDGVRYWGAQEPAVIEGHLAVLRPMLDGYPAVPDGYDGWWRFLTTAEQKALPR